MFIISEHYDEFTAIALSSYKEKDIKQALAHHCAHPNLVRRLVTLKQDKVKLTSVAQNPWYDEMSRCKIRPIHVEIIEKYLKFKEKKKNEELADFKKHRRGSYAMSANYTRLPSNRLKVSLKQILGATEASVELSEEFGE